MVLTATMEEFYEGLLPEELDYVARVIFQASQKYNFIDAQKTRETINKATAGNVYTMTTVYCLYANFLEKIGFVVKPQYSSLWFDEWLFENRVKKNTIY